MIRSLTIENFRALRELHLVGLGRVNLLVGANNSGKTSVLEAVSFLASEGDLRRIYATLVGRRERAVYDGAAKSGDRAAVDIRHIFYGRTIGDDTFAKVAMVTASGAEITLRLSTPRAEGETLAAWQSAMSRELSPPDLTGLNDIEGADRDRAPRYLRVEASGSDAHIALRPRGLLSSELAGAGQSKTRIVFVPTTGIPTVSLARLYDQIVLTPEEAAVVEALRSVEHGIERLATRQTGLFDDYEELRDFVVAMEGSSQPIPLGSLGDGVHRMLAIALCLVAARGGYLFVDEIDTGLHHTVMQRMWRLVFETAKRLDVTVFATTHSYDCVHALTAIARPDIGEGGEVSLVRVERDNPKGVHFTEAEISNLVEWRIEAR